VVTGWLAPQQECLRKLPLATDLERAESLVPEAVRSLGLGLPPELQLVEVLGRDLALTESFEQVIAQGRR
jgi:hypothetical protein